MDSDNVAQAHVSEYLLNIIRIVHNVIFAENPFELGEERCLEKVKIAHSNGMPLTAMHSDIAIMGGWIHMLEYLYEEQAPCFGTLVVNRNCDEFVSTYEESWRTQTFDVLLPWQYPKVARN